MVMDYDILPKRTAIEKTIGTKKEASLEECKEWCDRRETCGGFEIDQYGDCRFYAHISDKSIMEGGDSTLYVKQQTSLNILFIIIIVIAVLLFLYFAFKFFSYKSS